MSIKAKELAELLNISAATVSMVLNNKPGISEETRQRVLEAAQKYNCPLPKSKEQSVSDTIHFIIYKKDGAIVTDTPFFAHLTEGITQKCRQLNCLLQISYFYENENTEEQLNMIKADHHSGILLLGTEINPNMIKTFQSLSVPMVILDYYDEDIKTDCVLINNHQGAYHATRYLIDKGHKKIGYLRSRIPIGNFNERAEGHYKALKSYKLEADTSKEYLIHPSLELGYLDLMQQLKENKPTATAYFADNDIIAAAALRAFQENGYKIPEDLSIIGFDDMPLCQYVEPALTTMRVPKLELGAQAIKRLYDNLHSNDNTIIKIALSTELIERASVREITLE